MRACQCLWTVRGITLLGKGSLRVFNGSPLPMFRINTQTYGLCEQCPASFDDLNLEFTIAAVHRNSRWCGRCLIPHIVWTHENEG